MRYFICNVWFFLFPILIFIIFAEIRLRGIDNDCKYKKQWLTEYADSVKVLVLGSSHSYFGVNPDAFRVPAFNAAYVSQDLKRDSFILSKFIHQLTSLQTVILPVSMFSPFSLLEKGEEAFRMKNYVLYYDYPFYKTSLKYWFEIANFNVDNWRQLFAAESHRQCSDLGWGTAFSLSEKDFDGWKLTGEEAAKRHSSKTDLEVYNENLEIAKGVLGLCKSRHINVLLLTTPTYITYRENISNKRYAQVMAFCDSLVNDCPGTLYLNLFDDKRFVEDDFFDADHLSDVGALKLSRILDDYLSEVHFVEAGSMGGKNDL